MAETPGYSQGAVTTGGVTGLTAAGTVSVVCIRVANVDGVNSADVTIAIDPSGVTAATTVAHTIPVPADAVLRFDGPFFLSNGDAITLTASADNDLTYRIDYLTIT